MAAVASHHVRLVLFPLRLDTDRQGYLDLTRSLGRRHLLMSDVNTVRETNNAIFEDIFWVHLAYASDPSAEDRMASLRTVVRGEPRYQPLVAGFETIDEGRRVLEDGPTSVEARTTAEGLVWQGNVALLEHEQRALVQPNFDRLSCAFARLVSIGAATAFEVRGVRNEVGYFTSFYGYSLTRGIPNAWRARAWPRITRYDDRWTWLVNSVVPRFRAFDAQALLIRASLRRIAAETSVYKSMPCMPPLTPA